MKIVKADLLSSVVSVYDQTKTTTQGRITSKTIGGRSVLGPPLNKYIDTFADFALAPNLIHMTSNGRIFICGSEAGGITPIFLYSFNPLTGAHAYVGSINVRTADVASTTTTFRGLKVSDSGTTGWKIFIASIGSVPINGGLYLVNDVELADFVPTGPPTINFATGNSQKAVYFLQDPSNIGVGQLNITTVGMVVDWNNNLIYVHNGSAATHQYFVHQTNVAPTYASAAVTIDETTDVVTQASHPYANNDPVVFLSLTGGAGLTVGTVYFARNVVAGVSYQLSATSGGAVISVTTAGTGTLGRAFGTTGSGWSHKTGNLPALTGTLLTNDSEEYANPGHTANAGQHCAFFATTTQLYLGRLSELTPGVTTWPSLVGANLAGATGEIVTPTLAQAVWSNILDRAIFSASNRFYMKQVVNNSLDKRFGILNVAALEGTSPQTIDFGAILFPSMDLEAGWLAIGSSTVGQRGIMMIDLSSDEQFQTSYVVTKVLTTPNSTYNFASVLKELQATTGSVKIQYRTSGFGSISGGWTNIDLDEDLSLVAPAAQIQFKILFRILERGNNIPAQVSELNLGITSINEMSENWEYSHDDSSSSSPSRIAFRQKGLYAGAVPQLTMFATDLSNSVVTNHNTVANAALFEYSTNDGVSWLPLGTIPNAIGTLIRYNYSSPPGVDIRVSIKES